MKYRGKPSLAHLLVLMRIMWRTGVVFEGTGTTLVDMYVREVLR